jgi:uncharacterized protein (UPF0332 family)
MKDLKAADSMLNVDLTWALTIAYHAMIRASRALMYSKGYLPTSQNSHKTTIEFTGLSLGQDYEITVARFNRLRRKRHDFIYDSVNGTTEEEARSAIKTARALARRIIDIISKANPDRRLL